jgi:hypothetical protein
MPHAHVLLLGDALRVAYQSRVKELLAEDGMTCAWPEGSCGSSRACREGAEGWLREHRPDIVVFGCGPHAAEETHAVHIEQGCEPCCSLGEFELDLASLAQVLRRHCGRQVVYVTTPQLHVERFARWRERQSGGAGGEDGRDLAESINSCIDQYTEMAKVLMGEFNVMVADLHHDLAPFLEECIGDDGWSLSSSGVERAARTVAAGVLAVL